MMISTGSKPIFDSISFTHSIPESLSLNSTRSSFSSTSSYNSPPRSPHSPTLLNSNSKQVKNVRNLVDFTNCYRSLESVATKSKVSSTIYQNQPISSLATFAAEMISWLWFSDPTRKGKEVSRDQVAPSAKFLSFCHNLLTTTQVSRSVVILALLYISRLKSRNSIHGASGSEYRLTTTALMMANKILDDNTYTAKTWAEVASLELKPLVAGEAEFLRGLDFQLNVSKEAFDGWMKLLEGHVAARKSLLASKKSNLVRDITGSKEVVGLGLSSFTFSKGDVELRRHSATGPISQHPKPLSHFSFPPRHSSLSIESTGHTYATHSPSNSPRKSSTITNITSNANRNHAYPPTIHINNESSLRNNAQFKSSSSYTSPSTSTSTIKSLKRQADTAFSPNQAIHYLPLAKRSMPSWGTYNLGSPPAEYTPVTLPLPLPLLKVEQSLNDTFQYLSDAFSPVYDCNQLKNGNESLSFYSLAAGQRQGLVRQALPIDRHHYSLPVDYHQVYQPPPPNRYFSQSPPQSATLQSLHARRPSYSQQQPRRPSQSPIPYYSPARSVPSGSPTEYYTSTPPQHRIGVAQSFNSKNSIPYSYFSNSGFPGVYTFPSYSTFST